MKLGWLLAAMLALPAWSVTQDSSPAGSPLPAGTILPVSLSHGLDAEKLHAGQTVRARLMQSIPDTRVDRGATVVGRVVQVKTAPGAPTVLELSFDAVENHGQRIPIRAGLRAVASPQEVRNAHMPEEMSAKGLTASTGTTRQIGGDQVYRGGGPVAEGNEVVGKPVPHGVEGAPQVNPGEPCRAEVADNSRPQAWWVFSVNACGVYGFPNLVIEHSGRNTGTIVLTSSDRKLNLGGGSAMLLRVE